MTNAEYYTCSGATRPHRPTRAPCPQAVGDCTQSAISGGTEAPQFPDRLDFPGTPRRQRTPGNVLRVYQEAERALAVGGSIDPTASNGDVRAADPHLARRRGRQGFLHLRLLLPGASAICELPLPVPSDSIRVRRPDRLMGTGATSEAPTTYVAAGWGGQACLASRQPRLERYVVV